MIISGQLSEPFRSTWRPCPRSSRQHTSCRKPPDSRCPGNGAPFPTRMRIFLPSSQNAVYRPAESRLPGMAPQSEVPLQPLPAVSSQGARSQAMPDLLPYFQCAPQWLLGRVRRSLDFMGRSLATAGTEARAGLTVRGRHIWMFCLRFSFGHWEKSGEARRGCFLRSGVPSRGPYKKILALPGLGSFVSIRMQHACMYVRTFVCMPLCMSVSMFVCSYVCTYACIYESCTSVCLFGMHALRWVGRSAGR